MFYLSYHKIFKKTRVLPKISFKGMIFYLFNTNSALIFAKIHIAHGYFSPKTPFRMFHMKLVRDYECFT